MSKGVSKRYGSDESVRENGVVHPADAAVRQWRAILEQRSDQHSVDVQKSIAECDDFLSV